MNAIFLLTLAYMFLSVLLLLGVIYSRVGWQLKTVLIALSLVFTMIFAIGYIAAQGYPVADQPPEMFRFISGMTREPSRNDPGAIFVWLMDTTVNNQPRALALPYSPATRDMVDAAEKRVRAGEMVYLGRQKSGQGQVPNQARAQSGSGSNSVPYQVSGLPDLHFVSPPDHLPLKP
jgi:hypothetical protein